LPLEKIASGGPELVHFTRKQACPDCSGSGAKAGTKPRTCAACKGTGQYVASQHRGNVLIQTATTCANCSGRGKFIDEPCPKCSGTGENRQVQTLEIQIPPGIEEGAVLRVPGHGEPAPAQGGLPGDLYVHVTSADPRFTRMGADLWYDAEIPVTDAVLGASRKVPALKKPVTVQIPAGTQPGTVLRLKGKGLPEFGGKGHGDLLVRVTVKIPAHLNAEELKLWQQLRNLQERLPT
jgi:molecular chaperone DnaJ